MRPPGAILRLIGESLTVNISKLEQRVLHVLAQGGLIQHIWADNRIIAVDCYSRDGYRLADCTLDLFRRLKRRGLIESRGGGPYRISRLGLTCVRAQLDNR
jgi:uncharacterized protein YjhX (UPF0386 family)